MRLEAARRVHSLFMRAAEIEPEARRAFLDEACGDAPSLRAEVESLLSAMEHAGTFLESSALVTASGDLEEALARRMIGRRIGHYTIKNVIASGGMGTVYLAEQDHPRRTVALKLMRAAIVSTAALRRFEYEAQVLARLNHRNVAQVYEAGTYEAGGAVVPYFALEFVPNAEAITDYVEGHHLDITARLELFVKVCAAVNHGHQNGVIHRDLKPANILVDAATGEPKIIDFGVARATNSDIALTTMATQVGELLGTLQYMSPEQFAADPDHLDIRSDVYTLGVVLYELLYEQLPYEVGASVYEAARIVREAPSRMPISTSRLLRGDLETIVLKALEKDRDRRYDSAAELARDIRRYLDGRPISARPPTLTYQLRMFARRNRTLVGALAAIVLTLVAAVTISVMFAINAMKQRDAALRQTYAARIEGAVAASSAPDARRMRHHLARAPEQYRGWEWHHLQSLTDMSLATLRGHEGIVASVAFSHDGTRLASSSKDATIRIWDASSGELQATLRGHDAYVQAVAFSPDGRLGSASSDSMINIWRIDDQAVDLRLEGHEDAVLDLDFSPDGRWVASGSRDGTVRIWDALSGREAVTIAVPTPEVRAVDFSADGRILASAAVGAGVQLWNVLDGSSAGAFPCRDPTAMAFSLTSPLLACGSRDKTITIWNTTTAREVRTLTGHIREPSGVAFSPDGRRLASSSSDETIRLWDVSTGETLVTLRGHERPVFGVAFHPDGTRLASCSVDNSVKLWDAEPGPLVSPLEHEQGVFAVAFDSSGTLLATGTTSGRVRVWDTTTGGELAALDHRGLVRSIAFSPDGHCLAVAAGSTATLWNSTTGARIADLRGHEGELRDLAFTPDGAVLATASIDATVRLWSASTGAAEKVLLRQDEQIHCVAFTADGRYMATSLRGGAIKLWEFASMREVEIFLGHERDVASLAFSPDDKSLASGSHDGTVRVWRVSDGKLIHSFSEPGGWVNSVAYTLDGTRIASASRLNAVKLWDAASGEELTTLGGHTGWVTAVTFSPDGARLASASWDRTVRIWDTEPPGRRLHERRRALARYVEVEPIVKELFVRLGDADAVERAVRSNPALDEETRRVALRLVLRLAVAQAARGPAGDH